MYSATEGTKAALVGTTALALAGSFVSKNEVAAGSNVLSSFTTGAKVFPLGSTTTATPGVTSTHGQTIASAQIRRVVDKDAMSMWLTGERGDSPQGKGGILTTLTTTSGVKYRVATRWAAQFAMFVAELESTGYKIRTVSAKRETKVRATGNWSFHTLGMAIDINYSSNRDEYYLQKPMGGRSGSAGHNRVRQNADGTETPMKGPKRKVWNPKDKSQTDLPANIGAMAAKYGLGWGGNWTGGWRRGKYLTYKDPMHFSAAVKEGGVADIGVQKTTQGLTPELLQSGWVVPLDTDSGQQYYSIPMGHSAFMKGGNLPVVPPSVFRTLPQHIQEQITRYNTLQGAALQQGGSGTAVVDNSTSCSSSI